MADRISVRSQKVSFQFLGPRLPSSVAVRTTPYLQPHQLSFSHESAPGTVCFSRGRGSLLYTIITTLFFRSKSQDACNTAAKSSSRCRGHTDSECGSVSLMKDPKVQFVEMLYPLNQGCGSCVQNTFKLTIFTPVTCLFSKLALPIITKRNLLYGNWELCHHCKVMFSS